jgi:4-aminobutyrate aminotransferase/(S)-3-amino-2-methylpropionate transaminase
MALSELPPALGADGEPGHELPKLRTAVPGAMSRAWLQRLQGVDAPWTDARRERRAALSGVDGTPIVLASAQGTNVVDVDGNRFVDFACAFGAALLGHGNSRVARTLEMQSTRLMMGLGDVFPSDAKISLTERLSRLYPEPGARVMLGLSGSDAIEAALKTALLATGKAGVVAFEGAYHGLSLGPLAACGLRPEFRAPFTEHLSKQVRFAPYPADDRALDRALAAVEAELRKGDIGAIVVEPVLGRGGVVVPPDGFLSGLRSLCDVHGALFVADEIWTGLGRSGSLLRTTDLGVRPDLVCLGKGLGGGLPMSACIGRKESMEAWRNPTRKATREGDEPEGFTGEAIHTSTHAGHPLACAAAIATLDAVIGGKLHERARTEGETFRVAINEAITDSVHGIREVRGVGMMIGIHLEGGPARGVAISRDLLSKGWIVLTGGAGDVLTLTPPLNVGRAILDGFVEALHEATLARPV